MANAPLKIFLSHNSADKPQVENIALRLREEGFDPWLDKWDLIPGETWQEGLEKALRTSDVCLIFIGEHGQGPWHQAEMRVALNRNINQLGLRVIPVLLPDAAENAIEQLPDFLQAYNGVRFYQSLEDKNAFQRLVKGIKGERPGPDRDDKDLENPYRGLQYFDIEHADFFFGRNAVTQILLNHIKPANSLHLSTKDPEPRFLAVIGASGSGKSSLVRAGLLASLEQEVFPGSGQWLQLILKPGEKPLQSLAVAINAHDDLDSRCDTPELIKKFRNEPLQLHYLGLESLHGDDNAYLLILVDQFEEIFSLCHDRGEREAFLDNLLAAATDSTGRIIVVLTMRADFYANCSAYPQLSRCLERQQYLLNPMDETELREAIVFPARCMGCELESGLVELIVKDVQEQPGTLPLLQYALMQLWEQRRSTSLRLADYQQFGGLAGALEQRANQIYEGFSPELQEKCQLVFQRLVQPGEGTVDTRRRCRFDEFEGDESTQRVIRALTNARLLTTQQEDGVAFFEVSHEALIRGWSQLREWIDDGRELLRLQHQISSAAQDWKEHGRDDSWLWSGSRLLVAEEWMKLSKNANNLEQQFIAIGLKQKKIEKKRELRQQSRLKWLSIGMGIFAALMFITSIIAIKNMNDAKSKELTANYNLTKIFEEKIISKIADYKESERKIGSTTSQEEALFYTLKKPDLIKEAFLYAVNGQARKIPKAKIHIDPGIIFELLKLGLYELNNENEWRRISYREIANIIDYEISPNGKNIAIISSDNILRIWDSEKGRELTSFSNYEGELTSLAYSLDSHYIAAGTSNGTIIIWNTSSKEKVSTLKNLSGSIDSLLFLPKNQLISGSSSGDIVFFNITKSLPDNIVASNIKVKSLTYTGRYIFALGNKRSEFLPQGSIVQVWDNTGNKASADLECKKGGANKVHYNRKTQALLVSTDYGFCFWDAKNIKKPTPIRLENSKLFQTIAISNDGNYLARGRYDKIDVISIKGQKIKKSFNLNSGHVEKLSYLPSDKKIIALHGDRTVRSYALKKIKPRKKIEFEFLNRKEKDNIRNFCFLKNGETIAINFENGLVGIFNSSKVNNLIYLNLDYKVDIISCNPKKNIIALGLENHSIDFYDLNSRKVINTISRHTAPIKKLLYSPDGKIIASFASIDKFDNLFTSSEDNQEISHKENEIYEGIYLWNTENGKIIRELPITSLNSIAFHPFSSELAFSRMHDKNITIWNTNKGIISKTLALPKKAEGLFSGFGCLSYSNDGELLSSCSLGNIHIWNTKKRYSLETIETSSLYIKTPTDQRITLTSFMNNNKKIIVSLLGDGRLVLWNTQNKRPINIYKAFNHSSIRYFSVNPRDSKIVTAHGNKIRLWDESEPVYKLLYEFNPLDVSIGLNFLWDLKPTSNWEYNDKYPFMTDNVFSRGFNVPKGETDKFRSLLDAPNHGETKLDQLVRWLEERGAYRKKPAGMPAN